MPGGGAELRRSERAAERDADAAVRETLSLLQHRLADRPLDSEAAATLARAVEALGRRLADVERSAAAQNAAVAQQLVATESRLTERLDGAVGAIARIEAATEPAAVRLILGAAAFAAAVSVLGAGILVATHPEVLPQPIARAAARFAPRPLRPGFPVGVRLMLALQRPERRATLPAAVPNDTVEGAVQALQRGDATALARLTGLAQAGDPQAALQLAGLYEAGAPGMPRDLAAARTWTERAAAGGERVAMHNMGLFLMNGEGGPRDLAAAAQWFRRAADRGVVDSQFNLGVLYESGRGVERNLREAYRWFSVAANAGDVAAREKQLEVEARLTPAERAGLDHAVSTFEPGALDAPDLAALIPPAATLAETQALLARQGYYVGPIDGANSPALRTATAAYLRDHPGAATAPFAPKP